MARNRGGRNRNKNTDAKSSNAKGGSKSSGSKNSRNQSGRGGNKRRGKSQKITARTYWGGHTNELPEPPTVHPSADPSAIVRSLGTPPLPGQAHNTEETFAAVYDRAVLLATALAAAGDLLED